MMNNYCKGRLPLRFYSLGSTHENDLELYQPLRERKNIVFDLASLILRLCRVISDVELLTIKNSTEMFKVQGREAGK